MEERAIDRAIRWALDKGWNQTRLASEIVDGDGNVVSKFMLSNWKKSDIPDRWLVWVGKALGRSAEELIGGRNGNDPLDLYQGSNVKPLITKRKIPMLSFVQAGVLTECVDLDSLDEVSEWISPINSSPGPRGFALRVQGDSMVALDGRQPSFPEGTVLIVEPERSPKAGDYVIARELATGRATFKRLTGDGVAWYLKPLNPSYPTYEIDDPGLRVVGVVIEAFHSIKL